MLFYDYEAYICVFLLHYHNTVISLSCFFLYPTLLISMFISVSTLSNDNRRTLALALSLNLAESWSHSCLVSILPGKGDYNLTLAPISNLLALGFTGWRTLHSNSCSQSQSRPRFHSRCTTDILGLPLHIKIDLRHDISANISDLYLEPLDQDLKFKVRTIGSFWFFLFCLCFKPLDLLDYF